ncbi:hypothetical protein RJT34_28725 [Clitoria ternatea]|uniref:Uncharacterized protein n=1 Tax=Clitoria ternatea TaxID=43366 RepID=A0AAN9IH42_CLITE
MINFIRCKISIWDKCEVEATAHDISELRLRIALGVPNHNESQLSSSTNNQSTRVKLGTMSRPMLLVFLLIILIITSQFEWKQQLVADVDSNPSVPQKQQHQISKAEDTVKEKIILVQEKNIRRLNELVRQLQEQLQQCRRSNGTLNGTVSPLAERTLELERQQILED